MLSTFISSMSTGRIIKALLLGALISFIFATACEKEQVLEKEDQTKNDSKNDTTSNDSLDYTYDPTPYPFDLPSGVPKFEEPDDNPTTEEGVELGRMLFYDPILSGDSSLSCAGCHNQNLSFADSEQFSPGIDGSVGNRNAMKLVNVAYNEKFNWHGSTNSLEEQALEPVTNPVEMNAEWPNVVERIQQTERYPKRFGEAFNTTEVTKERVVKAIAQFERTLLSFNSKYDKVQRQEAFFTQAELRGEDLYFSEDGDCFHCHGGPLLTSQEFHNNGLDSTFSDDPGLYEVTGDSNDLGLFKSPTLRNVELTAPYMHDGRFQTLREVIDHYSEGVTKSETIDPLMKKVDQGGLQLTKQEKDDLIAFLKTFTDKSFVNDTSHSNPFQ